MDTGLCIVKYAFFVYQRVVWDLCFVLVKFCLHWDSNCYIFFLSFHCFVPSSPQLQLFVNGSSHRLCFMFGSMHSSWVITSSGWKDHFEDVDCHFSKCLFCFISCSMLDVKFPFKALICRQTLGRLQFVNVNFTPSVPIQFVIPRVEDTDKSWGIKVGLCIKREVLEIKDLKSKVVLNLGL